MLFQGIVIRQKEAGENNRLITLYTRNFGKMTALAKGVGNPTSIQAGHLEIFNLAGFLPIAGKHHPIITSAQCFEPFLNLKSSLLKLALGYFLLELFDRLVYEGEKDPALWGFLRESLYGLNSTGETGLAVKNWLTVKREEMVRVLGYARLPARQARLPAKLARGGTVFNGISEFHYPDYFFEFLNQKKLFSLAFINDVLSHGEGIRV